MTNKINRPSKKPTAAPPIQSMADKIFPTSKPTTVKAATTTTTTNPSSTATKPQTHNAARPLYRSHPHRHHPRRSCYCYFCLWIIFIISLLLIITACATAVMFFLYRPHRPSFSVSNLQISQFNLTSSNDHLTTRFNLTVTARNRNNKIIFYYDPVSVSIHANGVDVGDGLIPGFVAGKKSVTTLKAVVRGENVEDYGGGLKMVMKEKKSLALKVEMEGKVKVKIERFESKKARVRVVCGGIKAVERGGESATATATVVVSKDSKCKVDLRIKIWKWNI